MEVVSQRQLRNDSGDILRRAAAGEVFRIRAGETTVDLHRSFPGVIDELGATGLLSTASDDDFADFPAAVPGVEPLDDTIEALRGDR